MTNGTKPMRNEPTPVEEPKIDDEGLDIDPEKVDTANLTPDEAAKLVKTAQTALAQKDHWKKKAIDPDTGKPYKDLLQESKAPKTDNPQPSHQQIPQTSEELKGLKDDVEMLKVEREKRQFGFKHGYSPEEVDNIFAFAIGNGLTPSQALDHPFVKAGIESTRKANNASRGIPRPSHASVTVDGKPLTPKSTDDEKRKAWPELARKIKDAR